MPSVRRRSFRLFAVAALVAACGGAGATTPSPTATAASGACAAAPAPPQGLEGWSSAPTAPSVFPVIVNSALTCGQNRLLFTLLDADSRPVASPDRSVSVDLYDLGRDPAKATGSADAAFVWGIENVSGYYVAHVAFAEAGEWGADFHVTTGSSSESIRVRFDVRTSTSVVKIGDPAPVSDTPTADSVDGNLAMISTDRDPDPAFYRVSVKDAIAAHTPFVVVFATPKFCTSALCGPTLDQLKPIAAAHPDVAFIHVEPYQLIFQDGSLQPVRDSAGYLQATPIVDQWGLLTEPWVFVVDKEGIVRGSFEGVVLPDELNQAIAAVE